MSLPWLTRCKVGVRQTEAGSPDRPREIEAELKKLRREVANLTRAIAGDRAPKAVVGEIAAREAQIEALEKERSGMSPVEPSELDLRWLRKAAEARISRFRDLLREDVPLARQCYASCSSSRSSSTP